MSDVKYEGCQICGCMVCLAAEVAEVGEAGEDVEVHGYVTASGDLYCAPCFSAIGQAKKNRTAGRTTGAKS